jgi:hypothetical protein
MTYTKPEILDLGNATSVIESTHVKPGSGVDGSLNINPAYDLDE